MDYSLQRLDENDVRIMRSLNKLFGEVFEDSESYHNKPPGDDYLTKFLKNKKNIVIVAIQEDKVIGGLVAYHLEKFESERSEVYLYDLAVSAKHQRKGIGTNLIAKLREVSSELGAYVVFVQADAGDAAIDFYRSLNPTEDTEIRNFDFDVDS